MPLNPTAQDKSGIVLANYDGTADAENYPLGDKPIGGEGLSLTGTVAHGQIVTITDSDNRFGARANAKPVYVNLGDALTGSSLGRDTGNYWGAEVELTTAQLNGSMASAIRYDFKPSFQPSFDDLDMPDADKPFITYIERYYDFDTTQSQYQNGDGDFNFKTNRPHHPGFSPLNNAYIGYRGAEGGNGRMFVEYVDGTQANYYGAGGPPAFQWLSEEFIFKHSTLNTYDGEFSHYRNNVRLNDSDNFQAMTISTEYPEKFSRMRLDQVSNGCGSGVSNVWGYFGVINIDDEYNGAYVCDTNDPNTATKRVRVPQTAWSSGVIGVYLLETELTLSSSYLLFRTGRDSWVADSIFLGDYV